MAVDYRLPLKLNVICFEDKTTDRGTVRVVIPAIVYIDWNNIVCMEEFVKTGIFPSSDNDSKVSVCTISGNFICRGNIEEFGNDWACYKLWKENRKIFNLN